MRFARLLSLAVLLFTGCAGYQIGPIKPTRMAKVHTIAVPNFRNDTMYPRLETMLATAVIKQIQQDGTYQIARDNDADVVLQGRVEQVLSSPLRSVRGNLLLTREYQLTIRCSYKITERTSGAIIDNGMVFGQTSFFVSGDDPISADINQDQTPALPLAAEALAKDLVSRLSEGW